MIPSGIKYAENYEATIHEVATGLYVVTNAYDGQYEFFQDRPMTFEDGLVYQNTNQLEACPNFCPWPTK